MSEDPRDLYNQMYAQRQASMPDTLTLGYWEDHYVTRFLTDNLPRHARVLDIGCGTGEIGVLLARRLPNLSYHGIDPSDTAIAVARAHQGDEAETVGARLGFQRATLAEYPVGEPYDILVLSHVVEHVADLAGLFAAAVPQLSATGSVYVIVPYGHHYDDPTHCWHFTPETLEAALRPYWRHVFVEVAPGGDQIAAVLRGPRAATPAAPAAPRAPSDRPAQGDFIAMLRVKNEAEWILPTLDRIAELVDGIVVLDDGSSDATPDLCRRHPKVWQVECQQDLATDEVRDKNRLLRMALAYRPKWVLAMDGDEVLEDAALEVIPRTLREASPEITAFAFEWLYFWDRPDAYRIDGRYANLWFTRLFRVPAEGAEQLCFANSAHGGNFHCGSVPANLTGQRARLPVRIKHYGYFHRDQRLRKHCFYLDKDPVAARDGYYDHLVDETDMILLRWHERDASGTEGKMGEADKGARYVWDLLSGKVEFDYPDSPRLELVNLVEAAPRRALEIGCHKGATGAAMKQRFPGLYYLGVEPNARAAASAASRLDQVLARPFQAEDFADVAALGGGFDAVILADVLEHLYDPWGTLQTLGGVLAEGGRVYVSLPNVRNFMVINDLINGRWRYEPAGLLDITHIRFFTLAEAQRMFAETGYRVDKVVSVQDPRVRLSGDFAQPATLVGENFSINNVDRQIATELSTVQFLFVLSRAA